ncbi:MAG TPA: tetratricopeptide repeat protein [Cyclobacteriaceae bacterium]|nr:tetratricopeptide repeat protein [Cyclobacteriaceae bacterium]
MRVVQRLISYCAFMMMALACSRSANRSELTEQIKDLELNRGEITLCGAGADQFGTVSFGTVCSEAVRADFNVATALLHSFEYAEAEKVFARIIDKEPQCLMAYWGAAMSMFHPLWEPPSKSDLAKGSKITKLARMVKADQGESREGDFLEAIATIYDQSETLDHRARLSKFEKASEAVFNKYPDDKEAAVFYALALRAASDPADKTYAKQRKAGAILEELAKNNPNHPGIVHYIIHTYDYPELAERALVAARSYAAVAPASAHAQHMPSHIFTRLGLWDEALQSNQNSISSSICYAEKTGIKGHWDEELHGMDYLVYAYLQRGDDEAVKAQVAKLNNLGEIYPSNGKVAYSVAAIPARYAVERKDWKAASMLELTTLNIPWEKCQWEKSNITFARLLGFVHERKLDKAAAALDTLRSVQKKLADAGDGYKANLLMIQVKASEGWIKLAEGKRADAIALMTAAADLEDKTEKHPVTPGEIVPARELLGDMYMETGQYDKALESYKESLARHSNRFNSLYSAGLAAERLKQSDEANGYYSQLVAVAEPNSTRQELSKAKAYLAK